MNLLFLDGNEVTKNCIVNKMNREQNLGRDLSLSFDLSLSLALARLKPD